MRERPRKLTQVLNLYKNVARREILKDFREDSCIASTRITIRVLNHFGYKAEPLPVECIVYNPEWVNCVIAGFHPPVHSEADLKSWCERHGAWSLGIGIDKKTTVGHLITILPRYGLIVDASLSQANRPAKNISLPPVFIGNLTESVWMYKIEKCLLLYRPVIENKSYLESPNWMYDSQTNRATEAIIAHIEPRL
jgi:hypothetical protein